MADDNSPQDHHIHSHSEHDSHHQYHHLQQQQQQQQQQQHQHHHHHHHHHHSYHHDHHYAATNYLLLLAGTALLLAAGVDGSYEQTCTVATRFRGPHPMGICGDSIPQILSLLCHNNGYRGYRGKRDAETEKQEAESEDHNIRSILLNKKDAFNYLQSRETRAALGRGRMAGYQGITCECCYNRCSIGELQQYCHTEDKEE